MLKKILNRLKPYFLQGNTNDFYTLENASVENSVKIFEGSWATRIPGTDEGYADLFDDSRIHELDQKCGGFQGKNVLEIGPLEAGHSQMMHRGGANKIVAVEANSKAYVKSLIVKEEFQLKNLELKFADAMSFLKSMDDKFKSSKVQWN